MEKVGGDFYWPTSPLPEWAKTETFQCPQCRAVARLGDGMDGRGLWGKHPVVECGCDQIFYARKTMYGHKVTKVARSLAPQRRSLALSSLPDDIVSEGNIYGKVDHDLAGVCESCSRAPARPLVIRRHVGMILFQLFYKVELRLCRECGVELIKDWTLRTLVLGWWEVFSLFVGNPFTIVMNLVALGKALQLTPPVTPPATHAPSISLDHSTKIGTSPESAPSLEIAAGSGSARRNAIRASLLRSGWQPNSARIAALAAAPLDDGVSPQSKLFADLARSSSAVFSATANSLGEQIAVNQARVLIQHLLACAIANSEPYYVRMLEDAFTA